MEQTENQLISLLPPNVRKRFLALCEPFELEVATELSVRGEPITHAYFPLTGFISLAIDVDGRPHSQVGMVGAETMLGSKLVLGHSRSPWSAVVVGEGKCVRIEARELRQVLPDMPELEDVLKRTVITRLHQLSMASTCERFHPLSKRLARWLLMSHDRVRAQPFRVTQEFISQMLGVRRSSVTIAAHAFQKKGLIEYTRAEVKVLNPQGLEAAACSCYQADKLLFTGLTIKEI